MQIGRAFTTIIVALGVVHMNVRGAAAPSPIAPDALLENQWHLKDRSTEAGGANVRNAWPMSLGAGVVIGIVDDGLQWAHPDLSPNYVASLSYDFNYNDADPQPFSTSAHGTAVAGLAAARGDNSIGVSGAAPQASLAGLRLTAVAATDAQEASAFGFQPNAIHILNNSWNPTDNGTTLKAPGTQAAAARQSAVTTGRNGKGRIFVWSSGNGRLVSDDCNFDGYANSRFAIAVGASTDAGNQMPNSEGCSALMIVAPAGGGSRGLTTTDLMGSAGYDSSDYTSTFGTSSTGGMSAAAPTVSGAVALMLARNPNLTWRDVQHILRRTSVRVLPTDGGWTSGAFPHNERLGFGLLDAAAAVSLAGQWTSVPAEESLAVTRNLNQAIPDINATGISDSITISSNESNFVIEHVEVDFNATHTWRGDLQVKLTSPAGVVSNLAPIRGSDSGDNFTNWKFGSVRHWGETAAGVWTLNVADRRYQDTGTWNNWTLRIYGYHTAAVPPGAFGKSSPTNGASGVATSATLSWSASNGATSYEYCYDTTNDNACSTWFSSGTSRSAALSGLAAGTTYYWQARANNGSGVTYADGGPAMFWSFTTQITLPGAFVKSSPANRAADQSTAPTLAWTASSGATNYDYCYDTINDNACNSGWLSLGNALSVQVTGLSGGTLYYWHVRATNPSGTVYANGSATAFWSFTTKSKPRPIVDLNGDGAGDVFTYSQATGAWSRQVSVATSGGFSTTTGSWLPGWTVTPVTFNKDLLTDFFLFNAKSGAWTKMINNGSGFTAESSGTWSVGWERYVSDLDGDGESDIFLYDTASGQWFRCLSTAAGFDYTQGAWNPGWEVSPMSLNADALGDMFLFNRSTGRWFWVLGDRDGFTSPAVGYWASDWAFTPGDFNGDGLTDLFLYRPAAGEYYVALNNGNGYNYVAGYGWAAGWTPMATDLNADGWEDLFLYNKATGNWVELQGNGAGQFTSVGQGSWTPGWELHPTDFNEDGRADLLLYNPTSGDWFKAFNNSPGTFTYVGGRWQPGLSMIVTPPVQ